jgi:hypothetical protein
MVVRIRQSVFFGLQYVNVQSSHIGAGSSGDTLTPVDGRFRAAFRPGRFTPGQIADKSAQPHNVWMSVSFTRLLPQLFNGSSRYGEKARQRAFR